MRPLWGAWVVLRELKLTLQGRSPSPPGATARHPGEASDKSKVVFLLWGALIQRGRLVFRGARDFCCSRVLNGYPGGPKSVLLGDLAGYLGSGKRASLLQRRRELNQVMYIGALPRRCCPQVTRIGMRGALHSRSAIPCRLARDLISVVCVRSSRLAEALYLNNLKLLSRKDASCEALRSHEPSRTKFPAPQMQNRA